MVNGCNYSKFANSFFKGLIIILISLFCFEEVNSQIKDDALIVLKASVNKEMSDLNTYYEKNYSITETAGVICAPPYEGKIEINLKKLSSYISHLNDDEKTILIRLIIAHEYIHLLQYEIPEFDLYTEDYQIRILESQADILASRYTIQSLYKEDFSIPNPVIPDIEVIEKRFSNVFKFFFDIGANDNSVTDHPSKIQRISSIYRGMRYAFMELLLNNSEKFKTSDKVSSLNYKKQKQFIEKERYQLNISQNDFFKWSMSQATFICHGNPDNLKNLARKDIIKTKNIYGKDNKTLIAIETTTAFINKGDTNLQFEYETRASLYRKNSNTTLFNNVNFNQNIYHTINFKPKESLIITESFAVPKNVKEYEIITPPDSSSLYFVTDLQTTEIKNIKKIKKRRFEADVSQTTFLSYLTILNDAISHEDISQLIVSFAKPSYKIDEIYSLVFNAIVPQNQNFTTKVSYDTRIKNHYQAEITFKKMQDSLIAIKWFTDYEKELSSIYSIIKKENDERGNKYVYFNSKEYPNNMICLVLKKDSDNYFSYESDILLKGKQKSGDKSEKKFKVYLHIRQKAGIEDDDVNHLMRYNDK